jgi:hypothetical protein
MSVYFRWAFQCLAFTIIKRKEKAHQEKRAALEQITEAFFVQHKLKSVQNMKINDDSKKHSRQHGIRVRRTQGNYANCLEYGCKIGIHLYGELRRKQLIGLIRLLTRHCRLSHYLNKLYITDNPPCDCGRGIENVKHFPKELKEKVGQETCDWRSFAVTEGNIRIRGDN